MENIVRRHFGDGAQIKSKGYEGCAKLCRKGARDIKAWILRGMTRVIVCHDADSNDPTKVREKVIKAVLHPSGFSGAACVTIPVEEIEAWIIADEAAITAVIPSFKFTGHPSPETIHDPKEWLCRQSRASNGKPLYSPATFNPAVAKELRFEVVAKKCPSFKAFMNWLNNPVPI